MLKCDDIVLNSNQTNIIWFSVYSEHTLLSYIESYMCYASYGNDDATMSRDGLTH